MFVSSKNLHSLAVLEALLVSFLWSSSYVLIKLGLQGMSPLSFAAIRYSLASLVLFAVGIARRSHDSRASLSRSEIVRLVVAGLTGYSIAQGLQFVGLYYLQAITTSFLLNFTPIFVLFLGVLFLGEIPTRIQVLGIAIALIGACTFFLAPIPVGEVFGILVTIASATGWATYMTVVRGFQRVGSIGTFKLTATTMGCGTVALLVSALALEGLPSISLSGWLIIVWLSVVNTALAFYLWNHTLRFLKAYELSLLQNTMLIQIAVLASIFLGEQLTMTKVLGIILVLLGVTLVQLRGLSQPSCANSSLTRSPRS